MIHIVSSLPGRIRLRHPALRESLRLERLRAELAALEGVSSVRANAAAGSLVVGYAAEFDAGRMEAAVAAAAAATIGARHAPLRVRHARVRSNTIVNRGMLGSLAASLLALAVGKRWHAVSGGVFLAFLVLHLASHRRQLLR